MIKLPSIFGKPPAKADGSSEVSTEVKAPAHAPQQKDASIGRWNAKRQLFIGFVALGVLVLGVGGWSALANIAGAIVATGMIEVEENRQVVQHPEGGVVGEIRVDDGDAVKAGDVLIRFDDTLLQSELAIVESQLFEIVARRGRLAAERDGLLEITFDPELLQMAESPEFQELIDGQLRLFSARRETRESQERQLRERLTQIENQIEGLNAQLDSLDTQLELINGQLEDQQRLLRQDLIRVAEVLATQREQARLVGQRGEISAGIAESRGRIAEIEIEILNLTSNLREEAITTLRDLQYRENELRERRLSTIETLSRLDVKAPSSGIVYGRVVNTLRSVVRPADPIMYIVPQDSPLVINSSVEAIHVDEVRPGQEATLRFSALPQRTTPEILGVVTKVSADVFTDEQTGLSYYTAEILPKEEEMDKLKDLELLPGMPVDTFIKTGDRTPLNYLVKPLADYFAKAFRES